MEINSIICGDTLEVLKTFPDEYIDMVFTSPPYWNLRDYGSSGQIGLEPTFQEFIQKLIEIFSEIKRVLKKEGTCWINLGDTYSGNKDGKTDKKVSDYLKNNTKELHKKIGTIVEKSLLLIPSRFTIAMVDSGWTLRNTIIWHKKNAMPSSVLDRFTNKYEQIFFFTKSKKYYFDLDSIRVPFETDEKRPPGPNRSREYGYDSKFNILTAESMGSPRARVSRKFNTAENTKDRELEINARKFNIRRPAGNDYVRNPKGKNPGDVWTLFSEPYPETHFATFPTKLLIKPILAGCPPSGVVLDPFIGSGTTAYVARQLGRNYIGIDISEAYCKLAENRLAQKVFLT